MKKIFENFGVNVLQIFSENGEQSPQMRSQGMAQHPSIIEFEPWLKPSFFYALSNGLDIVFCVF